VAALLANAGQFAVIAVTLASATALPAGSADRAPGAGRVRAALAYARRAPRVRTLLALQALALVVFTIAVPVVVVLAGRSLHAGAVGYGALLCAWGAGAVAGSAIYARGRGLSARALISLGACLLGIGYASMAAAPSLAVAIAGAVVGGVGNGIQAVAERTALQQAVQERWMALIMSFNESLFQAVPGIGILLGGALATLAGPRVALAVGGAGAMAITLATLILLRPRSHALDGGPAPQRSALVGA
jgi:MFS family permease